MLTNPLNKNSKHFFTKLWFHHYLTQQGVLEYLLLLTNIQNKGSKHFFHQIMILPLPHMAAVFLTIYFWLYIDLCAVRSPSFQPSIFYISLLKMTHPYRNWWCQGCSKHTHSLLSSAASIMLTIGLSNIRCLVALDKNFMLGSYKLSLQARI